MPTKIESVSSGHGIQVVTPSEEHTFILNEDALRSLLLREDIKDRAVVLVSVAGAFRKGKSFLLDFFLRYLDQKYNQGDSGGSWLGAPEQPLHGFSWRGGSERHTTGIHLWSQPFKATLDNGEKVVILLMDTQGTFDSESTVRDNATVFALSAMLSSVQIYNVSQNIDEDDLQHLQLFMDYGCVALDKIEGKPFQTLQFVVRDWSYPYDHPYGAVGGKELLNKRLKIHEGQHEELQKIRQHISTCFEELACFLLPYPGTKVATSPDFNGKLADISADFQESLKELVPMLFAPEHLVPKVINGQRVKARDLLNYFTGYMDIFNSDELPKPTSILQATAEANNRSAMAESRDVYETLMEEVCGGTKPYIQPYRLEEEHRRVKNKSLHAFDSKKKMGGDEMSVKYREQLVQHAIELANLACVSIPSTSTVLLLQDLEELYEQLSAHNEGKNLYRIVGTPAVFATVALLGYLLSVVGGMLGVQTLVALGQAAAMAAVVLLAVWMYTRMTGNMREIGMQVDGIANTIRAYVLRQAFDNVSHRAAAAAVGYSGDKKRT